MSANWRMGRVFNSIDELVSLSVGVIAEVGQWMESSQWPEEEEAESLPKQIRMTKVESVNLTNIINFNSTLGRVLTL